MVDFTGRGSSPMQDAAVPLKVIEELGDTAYARNRVIVPAENAAHGRSRLDARCRDCGVHFRTEAGAIQHVSQARHVVHVVSAVEIVPVDTHLEPDLWQDGAGVTARDRNAVVA